MARYPEGFNNIPYGDGKSHSFYNRGTGGGSPYIGKGYQRFIASQNMRQYGSPSKYFVPAGSLPQAALSRAAASTPGGYPVWNGPYTGGLPRGMMPYEAPPRFSAVNYQQYSDLPVRNSLANYQEFVGLNVNSRFGYMTDKTMYGISQYGRNAGVQTVTKGLYAASLIARLGDSSVMNNVVLPAAMIGALNKGAQMMLNTEVRALAKQNMWGFQWNPALNKGNGGVVGGGIKAPATFGRSLFALDAINSLRQAGSGDAYTAYQGRINLGAAAGGGLGLWAGGMVAGGLGIAGTGVGFLPGLALSLGGAALGGFAVASGGMSPGEIAQIQMRESFQNAVNFGALQQGSQFNTRLNQFQQLGAAASLFLDFGLGATPMGAQAAQLPANLAGVPSPNMVRSQFYQTINDAATGSGVFRGLDWASRGYATANYALQGLESNIPGFDGVGLGGAAVRGNIGDAVNVMNQRVYTGIGASGMSPAEKYQAMTKYYQGSSIALNRASLAQSAIGDSMAKKMNEDVFPLTQTSRMPGFIPVFSSVESTYRLGVGTTRGPAQTYGIKTQPWMKPIFDGTNGLMNMAKSALNFVVNPWRDMITASDMKKQYNLAQNIGRAGVSQAQIFAGRAGLVPGIRGGGGGSAAARAYYAQMQARYAKQEREQTITSKAYADLAAIQPSDRSYIKAPSFYELQNQLPDLRLDSASYQDYYSTLDKNERQGYASIMLDYAGKVADSGREKAERLGIIDSTLKGLTKGTPAYNNMMQQRNSVVTAAAKEMTDLAKQVKEATKNFSVMNEGLRKQAKSTAELGLQNGIASAASQAFRNIDTGLSYQQALLLQQRQAGGIGRSKYIAQWGQLELQKTNNQLSQADFQLADARKSLAQYESSGASPGLISDYRSRISALEGSQSYLKDLRSQLQSGEIQHRVAAGEWAGAVRRYSDPIFQSLITGLGTGNMTQVPGQIYNIGLKGLADYASKSFSGSAGNLLATMFSSGNGYAGYKKASVASSLSGSVKSVLDGDTLVLDSGERIRLGGIDAPEVAHGDKKGQAGGPGSKEALERLVLGKNVSVSVAGSSYDRLVGDVMLGGKNINEEMVRSGYAFDYKQFSGGKYADLEKSARADKLGITGMGDIAPSAFRHGTSASASRSSILKFINQNPLAAGIMGASVGAGLGNALFSQSRSYDAELGGQTGAAGGMAGALIGGALGSMVGQPGVGAALGGAVGGFAGSAAGFIGGNNKTYGMAKNDPGRNFVTQRGYTRGQRAASWAAKGAMAGAVVGAAIGTIIAPGIGTVIGGAIGAVGGAMYGGVAGAIAGPKEAKMGPAGRAAYQQQVLLPYLQEQLNINPDKITRADIEARFLNAARGMPGHGSNGMALKRQYMQKLLDLNTALTPYYSLLEKPGGIQGGIYGVGLSTELQLAQQGPFSAAPSASLYQNYGSLQQGLAQYGLTDPTTARALFTQNYQNQMANLSRDIGYGQTDLGYMSRSNSIQASQRGIELDQFNRDYLNFNRDSQRQMEQLMGVTQRTGNRYAYAAELRDNQQFQRGILDRQKSLLTQTQSLEADSQATNYERASTQLADLVQSQVLLTQNFNNLAPKIGDVNDELFKMYKALKDVNDALKALSY